MDPICQHHGRLEIGGYGCVSASRGGYCPLAFVDFPKCTRPCYGLYGGMNFSGHGINDQLVVVQVGDGASLWRFPKALSMRPDIGVCIGCLVGIGTFYIYIFFFSQHRRCFCFRSMGMLSGLIFSLME